MLKFLKGAFISSADLGRPKYEVIKAHEGYEERLYEPSVWVTTDKVKTMGLNDINSKLFNQLFKYIQKGNTEKQKIEMTVPVIRKIEPGAGPACENHVDMSFFVPQEFHEKPPEPTDATLHITKSPKMTVYSRQFSGFAKDEDFLREMQELTGSIPNKENIQQGFFYAVGYDSPWQMFNRRNEVWFVKKDKQDASPDQVLTNQTTAENDAANVE